MQRTFESHIFAQQMLYLDANDLDRLMSLYHPSAVLIRLDQIMHGLAAIQGFYQQFFEQFPGLGIKAVENYTEAEDIICGRLVINSYTQEQHLYFVLLLKHGKIIYDIATPHTIQPDTARVEQES